MRDIRVGIIGIGEQTKENLLPSLLQIPDVHIVAACDSKLEKAQKVRSFVKDVALFSDVTEMLDSVELDALVLACPPEAHRDIAMLAMRRGLHVFVEKPPCFTLAELEQMVAVAKERQVVTAVGLNFRFARPMQQIRTIVDSDAFGRAVHLRINHYANKPRTPLWGMDSTLRSFLLAQAIHSIDLAAAFGNSQIIDMHSSVQNDNGSLLVNLNVAFASGLTASIFTGSMFPYFEFEMKVVSDESKMISLDNLWNITLHETGQSGRTTGNDKRWRSAWQPGPLDSGYERSGYLGELTSFFSVIRDGGSFAGSFESMLPAYQIIEYICRDDRRLDAAPASVPSANLISEPAHV